MKKNYFYGAMAAFGLLAFSSCSSDDNSLVGPNPEELTGEQVIVLDMQDTDVLSTKSRPLYSTDSKGADMVTDVQLLVFGIKKDGAVYEFVKKLPAITNWNNSSSKYDYGRKKEIKLTGDAKLKTGDEGYARYMILAVGQDESNLQSTPAPFQIELGTEDKYVKDLADNTWNAKDIWNVSTTPSTGFMKTAAIDYANTKAGEIFSGVSTPIEFTADGGFTTTVLLKRQVAGVLGYFNRIPATVGEDNQSDGSNVVTGIRLVSSVRNDAVDLTISLSDQVDDDTKGEEGYLGTENVVNGFDDGTAQEKDAKFGLGKEEVANKDAFVVYEIDLKKWFKWNNEENTWSEDALLTEKGEGGISLLGNVKGWQNALNPSNSKPGAIVADGAVYGGEFVIPFTKNAHNTFELQLIHKGQDATTTTTTVLKAWSIKLDVASQSEKLEDTDKVYSIYRNHLYQVGKRGNGDSPTDPGNKDDKPQPLDKDQELIIKINDQWEFIHDMEIE